MMYNPSRGGVRGGADQFTWESVKNDKHRENYLGHSLMAPVGRWQKGKDLSWYSKERKDDSVPPKPDKSELASIKRAEEEAMLIALGHNTVRKTQALSKEDIHEALKRNTGERDEWDIERVDGVGASSQRVALLSGVRKDSKQKSKGVIFEGCREQNTDAMNKSERLDDSLDDRRKKSKKKSKKHKKEKKHHKGSYDCNSSDSASKHKTKHNKSESDSDSRKLSKDKKSKHRHKDYSSDESEHQHHIHQEDKKRIKKQSDFVKRRRHDTSESE